MRRIQIHLEEELDAAASAEAARRGISKAALIRQCVATEIGPVQPKVPEPTSPWEDMIGWLDDEPVDDIDAAVYGSDA